MIPWRAWYVTLIVVAKMLSIARDEVVVAYAGKIVVNI
jgi:hypothetical protein